MKNLLLGFSLTANVVLGYVLLQDKGKISDLSSRLDNLSDQVVGKAKQVKGAITGDAGDKISGNVEEGKGKVKEAAEDLKAEL
jgi:uncharacterized protein YjbJ (UPF0337 family)